MKPQEVSSEENSFGVHLPHLVGLAQASRVKDRREPHYSSEIWA